MYIISYDKNIFAMILSTRVRDIILQTGVCSFFKL